MTVSVPVVPLCVACKWHTVTVRYGGKPEADDHVCTVVWPERDPVTGNEIKLRLGCYTMRTKGGGCGPEGKLWEERDG